MHPNFLMEIVQNIIYLNSCVLKAHTYNSAINSMSECKVVLVVT